MNTNQNLAVTIGKNTLWGIVARVAQVGTRLVTIPIVIAHLGLGGYGIWSVIMTTAAYMRFGSVGVKSAFQKYVAEATGKGDYESVNELLSTGCAFMMALSVVLIPVSIFAKQLVALIGVPSEYLNSAARSLSVLALIMAMSNVGAVFEAIVMGAHRIDVARNFSTVFTVLEAIAIVAFLHFGYGLFAMAAVMAASELGFVACCAVASMRIAPEVRLARKYVTRRVVPELVRYAGSYQLVNTLEVLYAAILPLVILRTFGANTSGIYAVVTRLTTSAQALPDALLLPILSSGAMVYASGAVERTRVLMLKSFKVTLGLSLFPLAFIAAFGATLVFAWTGQTQPQFRTALCLVSGAALFQSLSMLQLVLYRTSGKALLDNVRQVLRIVTLLAVAVLARLLGFYGVLAGLAAAELFGMLFMLFAIIRTFRTFRVKSLAPDTLRLTAATAGIIALGALAVYLPLPWMPDARIAAAVRMAVVSIACAIGVWPALRLTRSVTGAEGRALLGVVFPRWRQA
jgi:O-antigen/teichoic acid export membrane protein